METEEHEHELMYREQVLALYKEPLCFGKLKGKTHSAHGVNDHCGDDIQIEAIVSNGMFEKIGFHGTGCAICIAATSLVCSEYRGMSIETLRKKGREDIEVLLGVHLSPARVTCGMLGLETLKKAVEKIHA